MSEDELARLETLARADLITAVDTDAVFVKPQAVLALLAEVRRLRDTLESLRRLTYPVDLGAENAALRAEVARLSRVVVEDTTQTQE